MLRDCSFLFSFFCRRSVWIDCERLCNLSFLFSYYGKKRQTGVLRKADDCSALVGE